MKSKRIGCPSCSTKDRAVIHNGCCSSCPHHADVMAGKYSDMSASAVPCIVSCRHTDPAICVGHDKALHVDDAIMRGVAQPQAAEYADNMALFSEFLREVMALPTITREIMFKRLRGLNFAQITADMSALHSRTYTVQAIHRRFVQCLQENPTLAVMFPDVSASIKRRTQDAK